uniref:lycopene beta-cyclase n=1 Tax=Gymnogongrus flabelliformis TaxID=38507 RepID=A0A2H4YKG7_9FLOR|nr:lycopene epsilon-cyclase [Ahnfeltiopsis flabelliformis]
MSPSAVTGLFVPPTVFPSRHVPRPSSLRRSQHAATPFRRIRASLSAASFDANSVSSAPSTFPTVTRPPASAPAPAPATPIPARALYDVAVIGAGPAGLSLSAALCHHGLNVVNLDATIEAPWPNHYGVWRDEFQAVGLDDCATAIYPATAVYAGPEKITLDRQYLRVDRVKLKSLLLRRCVEGGVRLCRAVVRDVLHTSDSESEVRFGPAGPASHAEIMENSFCDFEDVLDEGMLRAKLVVDCTGHALRFTATEPEKKFRPPWAQAAYGIEAEVESHPYQADQMLLMDFRDDHMQGNEKWRKESEARPTFLYVFPSGERRAFFEETSVIAPKAVPFEELKERLFRRLEHDGVKVKRILEEEKSLIPMGGSLPNRAQRVVGFGGAACLVHPATGYMVARTVSMAGTVAETIANGLKDNSDGFKAMAVSNAVWKVTWSLELRRQRDFLDFGAELLGVLDMDESRRFFDAFFALPQSMWSKFLCFKLDTPVERIYFALYFFVIATGPIRWSLLRGIFEIGRWRLIRSVLPLWLSAADEN